MRLRVPLKTLAAGLLAGGCVVAAGSWFLGSALLKPVRHPVPCPPGFHAATVSIPGPQHAVAGWWVDQRGDSPVVLLLHGIRSDRASMVPRARRLIAQGFSVLLIDLQGHGETPGEWITLGAQESVDVDAALEWIRGQAPGRRVGVLGCSLGGAALLLRNPPDGVDAVVLEAVFPRITQAIENRVRIRLGPLAPLIAPLLWMQLPPRLHLSPRDLEPIRFIHRLNAPVLVAAGAEDRHTPLSESRELFAAAAEPKELWVVPGAGPEDLLACDPDGYDARVMAFLRHHLGPVPVPAETRTPDPLRIPQDPPPRDPP